MLDLIDHFGEKVIIHHTLVAVDGPFACVTKRAFQLADVGGIYLPLEGRTPNHTFGKPELYLDSSQIEKLAPAEIFGRQPKPIISAAVNHRVDYAAIDLKPTLASVDYGFKKPEKWVISCHRFLDGKLRINCRKMYYA